MSSTSCSRFSRTARLTDGLGNTVDFKNVILIMTSNIGARHLQKKQGLGFASDREDDCQRQGGRRLVKRRGEEDLQTPSSSTGLTRFILFQSLSDAGPDPDCRAAGAELERQPGAEVHHDSVTEEAKKWILDKTLVDRSYGARPLRRALQRYVETP